MYPHEENMILRETFILTPAELDQELLYPENARVQLDSSVRVNPYDIGSLAFSKREQVYSNTSQAKRPYFVELKSLKKSRCEFLRNLYDHFFIGCREHSTILYDINQFKKIINWCDGNSYENLFDSMDSARKAYVGYVSELKHQIKVSGGKVKPETCNSLQLSMEKMFDIYFGAGKTSQIYVGITKIKAKRIPSKPPKDNQVSYMVKTALAIAKQFKEFVISSNTFPFKLKMPDYETYVFPSNGRNKNTPYSSSCGPIYNAVDGRISTIKEYQLSSKATMSISCASRAVKNALGKLEEVNIDSRHEQRMKYATLAMQAYMQLFIILTGIYPSEIRQLQFDEGYRADKDLFKNDYRAVKFRAGGKTVVYSLGDQYGYSLFKEYLELRDWVLNGVEQKYLFFICSKKGDSGKYNDTYTQLRRSDCNRFIKRLKEGKYVNKNIKNIPARAARKYKNLLLNELREDQEIAASLLGHSIETNSRDYMETTPDRQIKELELYWQAMHKSRKQIKIKFVDNDNDKSIPVGHCEDDDNPSPVQDKVPIEPNCKTQYGCLYCENYTCHADEEDIHKLLSLLYVLTEVRKFAIDFSQADSLFKELSIRIRFILDSMKAKSDELLKLVEKMEKRVLELGILTVFWEKRLSLYEDMGVVL
ncbi:MAG: hypothetical protein JKX78_07760 [Alteromonadaceae bacterium]|nr:hypothetical protein [Alteromonadaceae bacterium]